MLNNQYNQYKRFNTNFDRIGRNPGLVRYAKIKDIEWEFQKQLRGGVIPYTIYEGKTYFCLGQDTASNDLTDFGGGIKKTENRIDGALREFKEESLNVFGDINKESILDQIILYSSKMLILLIKFEVNPQIIKDTFQQLTKNESKLEINDIFWLSKDELLKIIQSEIPIELFNSNKIMYTKVRYFLQNSINIIKQL